MVNFLSFHQTTRSFSFYLFNTCTLGCNSKLSISAFNSSSLNRWSSPCRRGGRRGCRACGQNYEAQKGIDRFAFHSFSPFQTISTCVQNCLKFSTLFISPFFIRKGETSSASFWKSYVSILSRIPSLNPSGVSMPIFWIKNPK